MSQLLNTPTLVNQLINLSTEEKSKNIYVLHMTDKRQNTDDYN